MAPKRKAGLIDQRNRGRAPRSSTSTGSIGDRIDALAEQDDSNAALRTWLAQKYSGLDIQDIETIPLKIYLQTTAEFEVEPDERLRQLALHFEAECVSCEKRGWSALERIYARAIELEESVTLHHSVAVSAREFAETHDDNTYLKAGVEALHAALALDSDDPDLHYEVGMAHYLSGEGARALAAFDTALACDPTHAWSQLYRAHCLHDQQSWARALEAYDAVDLEAFAGPNYWRVDVLKEQRAECLLMTGDKEGALAAFDVIVSRYEREPNLAWYALSASLWRVAEGPLQVELQDRVKRLEERLTSS